MPAPSTADTRKLPSTVAGRAKVNEILGCSIASDWYRTKEADFVEQYSDRVGAGTTEAKLAMSKIAGDAELDSRSGI